VLHFQSPPRTQKVPINGPPPGSPSGALMELHVSSAFFYISLKFLDNSSPNIKKFHPSLEGPMKGPTPMFPKMGPPWKQTPISRALIGISFGVPSKGALLPGSTQ